MRLTLTRRGIAVCGAAGGLIAAGKTLGVPEFSAFGIAALVLVAFAAIVVSRSGRRLQAQRSAPHRVALGESTTAACEVTAPTFLELRLTEMIGSDGTTTRARAHAWGQSMSYRVPSERRGPVGLGPLVARLSDPFGLIVVEYTALEADQCVVHPRRDQIDRLTSAHLSRRGTRDRGEGDPATIREYQPGDELRRIHWRASARQDHLMVRDERREDNRLLTIMIDLRESSYFEEIVSAAYTLGWSWLESGALRIVDQRGRLLVDCPSSSALLALGDALGFLVPDGSTPTRDGADIVLTAHPGWAAPRRTVQFGETASSGGVWIQVTDRFLHAWNATMTRGSRR
ncbi:MAG: DUF58 domain-containing protein [Acidimicrobiia bacterium]